MAVKVTTEGPDSRRHAAPDGPQIYKPPDGMTKSVWLISEAAMNHEVFWKTEQNQ
jgi:hypothetical protein